MVRALLREKKISNKSLLDEKGQSLVEFVLLLVVVASLSYFFMAYSNKGLANYWTYFARIIVDDQTQNGSLTID